MVLRCVELEMIPNVLAMELSLYVPVLNMVPLSSWTLDRCRGQASEVFPSDIDLAALLRGAQIHLRL